MRAVAATSKGHHHPSTDTGGMHPADILLVFASKENDTPKVEELLRAGANPNIKVRLWWGQPCVLLYITCC